MSKVSFKQIVNEDVSTTYQRQIDMAQAERTRLMKQQEQLTKKLEANQKKIDRYQEMLDKHNERTGQSDVA